MMKKIFFMIILMSVLFSFISCNKIFSAEKYFNIALPYTALLRNYPNYLIATESYMKFYAKRDITSEVINIVRRGDVFVLVAFQGQDKLGYHWYEVRNIKQRGWVLSMNPILVHSIEEAEFVSKHTRLAH